MTHTKTASRNVLRTVRLDDAALTALLDRLDMARPAEANRRKSVRYAYRLRGCIVTLERSGGASQISYLAPTRNVSAGGMSFLHGNFLYPATPCTLRLLTSHGAWKFFHGKVVRCAYVEQGFHEVAVQFDEAIEPALFAREAVPVRVLAAEGDPVVARSQELMLRHLNGRVDGAATGEEAVERVSKGLYDLVIVDAQLPAAQGFETVREIRALGYTGTLAAASDVADKANRERWLGAGFDQCVAKPFAKAEIAQLLATAYEEPLISLYAADEDMAETVGQFVAELPAKLRALAGAITKHDAEAMGQLAQGLKASSGGHGFEPITSAAERLDRAMTAKAEWTELEKHGRELMRLCRLARGPTVQSGASAAAAVEPSGKSKGPSAPKAE